MQSNWVVPQWEQHPTHNEKHFVLTLYKMDREYSVGCEKSKENMQYSFIILYWIRPGKRILKQSQKLLVIIQVKSIWRWWITLALTSKLYSWKLLQYTYLIFCQFQFLTRKVLFLAKCQVTSGFNPRKVEAMSTWIQYIFT